MGGFLPSKTSSYNRLETVSLELAQILDGAPSLGVRSGVAPSVVIPGSVFSEFRFHGGGFIVRVLGLSKNVRSVVNGDVLQYSDQGVDWIGFVKSSNVAWR